MARPPTVASSRLCEKLQLRTVAPSRRRENPPSIPLGRSAVARAPHPYRCAASPLLELPVHTVAPKLRRENIQLRDIACLRFKKSCAVGRTLKSGTLRPAVKSTYLTTVLLRRKRLIINTAVITRSTPMPIIGLNASPAINTPRSTATSSSVTAARVARPDSIFCRPTR